MTDTRPLIVVLGASGLIGTAVLRAFAARPVRLRAVARGPVSPPAGTRGAAIEVRALDLCGPGAVAEAVTDADVVVHLVARTDGGWRVRADDRLARRVNVGVPADLVEALRAGRGTGRREGPPPLVVLAGSTSQDVTRPDGTGGDGGRPVTVYDGHKAEAEHLVTTAHAEGVVRALPLRLPTVYGLPGGLGDGTPAGERPLDRGVVSTMARRALAGEALPLWYPGVRREPLHVDDVADAFAAAVEHADRLAGAPRTVSGGGGMTLTDLFGDIAATVARVTGRAPVPVLRVPPPEGAQATDAMDTVVDDPFFRRITGWAPRVTWDRGVERTVAALAGASGTRPGFRQVTPPGAR
ncbi:hypothetical protein GCM10027160_10920 [Streptomyces calidiresistens]|uniref:NAD-dependent epimerase/dehydratase family protein n=1 Tax=Streptomyces calidiresistens TaxID=1485586 RepID=A0A7W3T4B4_9ACTN|nr:NAD-dependent epimerase/dehydratase family protein [Streptomyces calidiresistens]MBB0230710.1 NAD-dependent epimerase/dehydratase family protein [Streptomyces calidiresistens]